MNRDAPTQGGGHPLENAATHHLTPPTLGEKKPAREDGVEENNLPRGLSYREMVKAYPHAPNSLLQCKGCGLWFEWDVFPSNQRKMDGRSSLCRECHAERNRRWRADNPDYVAEYNAARREGPFPIVCAECGKRFEASRRMQKRCRECQATMRNGRKR